VICPDIGPSVAQGNRRGSGAVKAVDSSTRVLLHLTNINNGIGSLTWWLDEVVARHQPVE
jgi:arabinogalactan endo-1,4-beta-galactosidase